MGNESLKKMPSILVIREKKIKTAMQYYTIIRMSKNKKELTLCRELVKARDKKSHAVLVGIQNATAAFKQGFGISFKKKKTI